MPLRPAILGRSFAGHARLRRPLPDVARSLSDNRRNAAHLLACRIVRLARRQGVPFASEQPGYWTRLQVQAVVIEVGATSSARTEFRVLVNRQLRMSGRFHVRGEGVGRLQTDTWNPGEWQRRLFRREMME